MTTTTIPTKADLEKAYSTGDRIRIIANQFGITKSHLYYLMREYGITPRRKTRRAPKGYPITTAEFKRYYYDPRMHQTDISQILSIPLWDLHRLAKRRGLLTRRELQEKGVKFQRKIKRTTNAQKWRCPTCSFLEHCQANPHADKLPCEIEATPRGDMEPSCYHSPNGNAMTIWLQGQDY